VAEPKNPMVVSFGCCARRERHAAAALPSNVMNV
jgi:hypothetical protein